METVSIGLDFGTDSCRSLAIDLSSGSVVAQSVVQYEHGVVTDTLPAPGFPKLPPGNFALQHPSDWLHAAAEAIKAVTSTVDPSRIIGLGVAFTSCTMLPSKRDGTPLCLSTGPGRPWLAHPHAWPKLWKHHGAQAQADAITAAAKARGEPWLSSYGGSVGLEWLWPKVLEARQAGLGDDGASAAAGSNVYDATDVWLEAGDWFVWMLTSCTAWDASCPGADVSGLVRSTCQAGYKGMWSKEHGWPSQDFLDAVGLPGALEKVPGRLQAPGTLAGRLSPAACTALGLPEGLAVSTAIIDAHAGVLGAGVATEDVLVLVMGTSSCHMLLSRVHASVPGVAGVVRDGILPGYYGYETGQASVGDAFAWVARTTGKSHGELNKEAALLGPGSGGVLCLDWLNGCRTPLMDGGLSGAFLGLTLATTPAQMYRAVMEGTGFGLRWIMDKLRQGGVPVTRFVASGGLPSKSPLLMQIYCDILGLDIAVAGSDQPVALGAALLGAAAAGLEEHGLPALPALVARCATTPSQDGKARVYRPDPTCHAEYDRLYQLYRGLTGNSGLLDTMRRLKSGQA